MGRRSAATSWSFENRPFGIDPVPNVPGAYQATGETVVEAIFGHSALINGGYAAGADRCVLLRWYATQADPTVQVGDWIADVTYERQQFVVYNPDNGTGRFLNLPNAQATVPIGVPNPNNNGEWDNMPPQRCIWYQVQKVVPATDDIYLGPTYRSMVVYVDRTLSSRTVLTAAGQPAYLNAAFISPYVANVIPQQFTVR